MPPDPFPGRGQDGEEPEGSGPLPLPAGGNGPGAGDGEAPPEGPEQGLFVCLPAEELSLGGFAQDGRTDTMAPGPLLAAVLHAVTGEDGAGLAGLSDDQLTGVMSAVRRLESRAAWTLMAAMREFARRRPAASGAAGFDEFAADELTGTLHLTRQSVAAQIDYACAVAVRLPRTFAALAMGQIHPVHVRIIEDETRSCPPPTPPSPMSSWLRRRPRRRSGSCGTPRTCWSSPWTQTLPAAVRRPHGRTRTYAGSARTRRTPG